MSFSFAMTFQPNYQKRYGQCKICHQGIETGDKIMIGTGFFHKHLIRIHDHYECWIQEVEARAKAWFFANDYKPKRMAPDIKAELNRLRAKRYYVKQKGGEPHEVIVKLAEIEKRIALAKSGIILAYSN